MPSYLLVLVIIAYLAALFGLGSWADRKAETSWTRNGWVYTLSLAVYCSAWTYYGSVGTAARDGLDFLTISLGPVIALPLWWVIMKRVVTLSHNHQVASLADFISFRYGNDRSVGAVVTLICVFAVVPYISLQLKAVSETFAILSGTSGRPTILLDSTFWIAVLLAIFAALFGTRRADAASHRTGLVFAVAVESVLKLLCFLLLGLYVVFYLFAGPMELFDRASELSGVMGRTTLPNLEATINWYFMLLLSFFAIFLLPRQFQVGVVENEKIGQLRTASWGFPTYLLLINLFVVFIAWAGQVVLGDGVNADYYALLLPLSQGHTFLALVVFIGGLSAAISMVVVSALALSTMISNNLIIPYGLLRRMNDAEVGENTQTIKNIRRVAIFALIVSAYLLYWGFGLELFLYRIGLVAFLVVAQLAPAFFIGLFWNRGSARGAKASIIVGTIVAQLVYLWSAGSEATLLLDPIPNAFMWSCLANCLVYAVVSVSYPGDYRERNYAEIVVNATGNLALDDAAFVWRGEAYVADIRRMLVRFLGETATDRALRRFNAKYDLSEQVTAADARLIRYSEKLLTGSVGVASARLLVNSITREQPLSLPKVLEVLEESRDTLVANKQLQRQSEDLRRLSDSLRQANTALRERDRQKDDFLGTLAHELKTPTASIRAAGEVLTDNEDMPAELRQRFLGNIVQDAERLSILIYNILDLEKLSSGREVLNIAPNDVAVSIAKAIDGVAQLARKKGVVMDASGVTNVLLHYDEDRIIQVLTNLLGNALKFVPEQSGRIIIGTSITEKIVQITVEDNGRGIPAEDIPFIFDKFFQSGNQNVKKPAGSGMGLAISRYIMDSHGGRLSVDPQFTNGARFIVELKRELA